MPMIPFMERFSEVGARETRSVTVTQSEDLPDGEYGFVEFYCNEPGCDCRRVIIQVLRPETGWSTIWATISYGWESPDFYRNRGGGAGSDPIDMKGPSLTHSTLSRSTRLLLNLFRTLVESPDCVERLRRHYEGLQRLRGKVKFGLTRQEMRGKE